LGWRTLFKKEIGGVMGLSLNIGCGDKILKNINNFPCINVDVRALEGVDVVCDVRELPFEDEIFDRILASDIIEHFPFSETKNLLREWARVLKKGGHIKFRTPSLKWVAAYYAKYGDAKFVSHHIFGGQDYDTNFHYVIFDNKWLSTLCKSFGLTTIDYKEDYSNFILVAKKD
jgi:predicted SAM-dependent methyltransferase